MLGIVRLLTDKNYRKKIVGQVTDPVVQMFWLKEFASYNDKMATETIAPILNKVGQFTASPVIRNIVGQPKSKIDFPKSDEWAKDLTGWSFNRQNWRSQLRITRFYDNYQIAVSGHEPSLYPWEEEEKTSISMLMNFKTLPQNHLRLSYRRPENIAYRWLWLINTLLKWTNRLETQYSVMLVP